MQDCGIVDERREGPELGFREADGLQPLFFVGDVRMEVRGGLAELVGD